MRSRARDLLADVAFFSLIFLAFLVLARSAGAEAPEAAERVPTTASIPCEPGRYLVRVRVCNDTGGCDQRQAWLTVFEKPCSASPDITCIAWTWEPAEIFADGFESGNTSHWRRAPLD